MLSTKTALWGASVRERGAYLAIVRLLICDFLTAPSAKHRGRPAALFPERELPFSRFPQG